MLSGSTKQPVRLVVQIRGMQMPATLASLQGKAFPSAEPLQITTWNELVLLSLSPPDKILKRQMLFSSWPRPLRDRAKLALAWAHFLCYLQRSNPFRSRIMRPWRHLPRPSVDVRAHQGKNKLCGMIYLIKQFAGGWGGEEKKKPNAWEGNAFI